MVYFTCGACGEQVKKPQVEKHYTQKCRRCDVLTCIDCLKDFYGDEYKAHNQGYRHYHLKNMLFDSREGGGIV